MSDHYATCPAVETDCHHDCVCPEIEAQARDVSIDSQIAKVRDDRADAEYERRERDRDRSR